MIKWYQIFIFMASIKEVIKLKESIFQDWAPIIDIVLLPVCFSEGQEGLCSVSSFPQSTDILCSELSLSSKIVCIIVTAWCHTNNSTSHPNPHPIYLGSCIAYTHKKSTYHKSINTSYILVPLGRQCSYLDCSSNMTYCIILYSLKAGTFCTFIHFRTF